MNEKNHIKEVLWKFAYSISPTPEAITTDLGVNSTESIMTMDKPVIKEIKNRLEIIVDSTVNTTT